MALGKYKGPDLMKGWGTHGSKMRKSGHRGLNKWMSSGGWGSVGGDPYGFGQKFADLGISEIGFDPTSTASIAEALAKNAFRGITETSIDAGPGHTGGFLGLSAYQDSGVWDHSDERIVSSTGKHAKKDRDRYEVLDEHDIGQYWDKWKEGNMGIYEDMAEGAGLTQEELGKLESTHSMWRGMEDPLIGEATDQYRGGLNQIMASLGGLRTGSAAKRRKELLEGYGQQVTDIRSKTAGARGRHSQGLVDRIANLFQS